MKEILKVKKLSYQTILSDVNLSFYENKIHYISGSNNCGKNTFMKILSGEINSYGQVFYYGVDINKMSSYEFNRKIGSILTLDQDFTFTTVREEILYKMDQLNLDRREHKRRYQWILSFLSLKEEVEKNIADLHDKQKLRLLTALQLIKKPKILLLGDVLSYIRKKDQEDFFSLLRQVEDLTVIVSNNDLSSSLYSDYLHLFHKGKLILSGKTMDVLKKDSMINKLGLDLPFMIDLSLKLEYYNLVEDMELDMNRMVHKLWK